METLKVELDKLQVLHTGNSALLDSYNRVLEEQERKLQEQREVRRAQERVAQVRRTCVQHIAE